jgi:hypothetical protein
MYELIGVYHTFSESEIEIYSSCTAGNSSSTKKAHFCGEE